FSSRRRHTRCYRDWSSDVCSSDLRDLFGVAHFFCGRPGVSMLCEKIRKDEQTCNEEDDSMTFHWTTSGAMYYIRPECAARASTEIGRASCRERGDVKGVDGWESKN